MDTNSRSWCDCGATYAGRRGRVSDVVFRIARLHRLLAGQLLREVGLHPSQELVMLELWAHCSMRPADLAAVVGTDAATMTRTLRRLERAGFVRRVPSPTDKRSVLVEPTVVSLSLRRKVEDLWTRLEEYITDGFDDIERTRILADLQRIEANLSRHTAEDVHPAVCPRDSP